MIVKIIISLLGTAVVFIIVQQREHNKILSTYKERIKWMQIRQIPLQFKMSGKKGEAFYYPVYDFDSSFVGDLVIFENGEVDIVSNDGRRKRDD